jgi:heme-degrading monooxygenase HmoA
MSVVKINVLPVPTDMRGELERRFAGRAGVVERADGFEHFELLRFVYVTESYVFYTRWRAEADFERWRAGQSFERGHAGARGAREGGASASGSELWSFEVVEATGPERA